VISIKNGIKVSILGEMAYPGKTCEVLEGVIKGFISVYFSHTLETESQVSFFLITENFAFSFLITENLAFSFLRTENHHILSFLNMRTIAFSHSKK